MRTLYATLTVVSQLTLGVVGILQADAWTDTTNRYLSGQLEPRLQELGTNKQTGVFTPMWRKTQEEGVKRHCRNVLLARGVADTSKCR
jgi:hypothetical protein